MNVYDNYGDSSHHNFGRISDYFDNLDNDNDALEKNKNKDQEEKATTSFMSYLKHPEKQIYRSTQKKYEEVSKQNATPFI